MKKFLVLFFFVAGCSYVPPVAPGHGGYQTAGASQLFLESGGASCSVTFSGSWGTWSRTMNPGDLVGPFLSVAGDPFKVCVTAGGAVTVLEDGKVIWSWSDPYATCGSGAVQ